MPQHDHISNSTSTSSGIPPDLPESLRIKRKPVSPYAIPAVDDLHLPAPPTTTVKELPPPPPYDYQDQYQYQYPIPRPEIRLRSARSTPALRPVNNDNGNIHGAYLSSGMPMRSATDLPDNHTFTTSTSTSTSTSTCIPTQTQPSKAKKAYDEVSHFLGGLITHPTSSTKHFTMLRHSHGIVFYRGSATSLALSIFSDAPLPAERTYWLQSKGWTGKTGMRAKALLKLHDDWVNVTPTLPVRADQVAATDERAWQRDVARFQRRNASSSSSKKDHVLRETTVLRIPVEAGDGYFQVVMCVGVGRRKKVLCSSPVFRVFSASMDPSSLRGASLSTLPLELGAMVAGLYAQATVQRVVGPVAGVVQRVVPNGKTQVMAKKAYEMSGLGSVVQGAFRGNAGAAEGTTPFLRGDASPQLEMGPVAPYPVEFQAKAEVMPEDEPFSLVGIPRWRLIKVPEHVLQRMHGYYCGWARMIDETGGWSAVVVSVLNLDPSRVTTVSMAQATKRVVALRCLDEQFPATSKVEVKVMGFLRPDTPQDNGMMAGDAVEAMLLADACDATVAQTTLDHPAWAPTAGKQNATWFDKTKDGYVNAQAKAQRFVEQVPLHRLGVRTPMDEMRDRSVTVNGFYILR